MGPEIRWFLEALIARAVREIGDSHSWFIHYDKELDAFELKVLPYDGTSVPGYHWGRKFLEDCPTRHIQDSIKEGIEHILRRVA